MADLNALVVFAHVVEANSFSEAARRLKMPTSTVSRRIAELEDDLGVRLLDRSTRRLRLTSVGAEMLEHAQRGSELSEAVSNIAANHLTGVSGTLRLSSPPSISDSFLAPLIGAFQSTYPEVRVEALITERLLDYVEDNVDLMVRIGTLKDSSLIARKILTYRHQLLASPEYLRRHGEPVAPGDLLRHRLLAFSRARPEIRWTFLHITSGARESVAFQPNLAMNDYAGLAPALLAGAGIGELPPLVRPELLRGGHLVEVMPDWHFRTSDLWLVHLGARHISRPVRAFKDFAAQLAPNLFPDLPS
jgi:DNA-binding transcriptional LysR family regulator